MPEIIIFQDIFSNSVYYIVYFSNYFSQLNLKKNLFFDLITTTIINMRIQLNPHITIYIGSSYPPGSASVFLNEKPV